MLIRKTAAAAILLTLMACAPTVGVQEPTVPAPHATHPPTACVPANGREGQPGCWVIATASIGAPVTPIYWHVYEFPSADEAQRHASETAKVIAAFGRTWLVAVAGREWSAGGGRSLAMVGPLVLLSSVPHTASFMEATFTPGMVSRIHTHPGPEAWVVVEGEQCLETSEGVLRAKAGDAMMVRGGVPMALFGTGTAARRALVLIVHPSNEPLGTPHGNWQPTGACGPM
jgi:quercetin dioxygenase-like cupin family protein